MTAIRERRVPWRLLALALAALCIVVLAVANVHLVYVAVTSQPDCVPHLKQEGGLYQAAKPAC